MRAALLIAARDPEREIVKWMREGAPTGFDGSKPMRAEGVFPPVKSASASVEHSRMYAELEGGFDHKTHNNYKSYYDNEKISEEEVERSEAFDYIMTLATWMEVLKRSDVRSCYNVGVNREGQGRWHAEAEVCHGPPQEWSEWEELGSRTHRPTQDDGLYSLPP